MPDVTLTAYECAHDLWPTVCVKCGAAATERIVRKVRDFQFGWAVWLHAAFFVGLFVFPPLLLLLSYRYARVLEVRLPLCDVHKTDYVRRDRTSYRYLIPGWMISVPVLLACGGILEWSGIGGGLFLAAGPIVLVLVLLIENLVIQAGAVQVMTAERGDGVRLRDVHPDFRAAVLTDRARARVYDPARRPARNDVRCDYDDEAV